MITRRGLVAGLAGCLILHRAARAGVMGEEPAPESSGRTRFARPPVALQDFVLTSQDGRRLRFSEVGEGAKLVYFGFTNCPNVCPAAMQKLRQVHRALRSERGSLTCVLVSVDGERDTPAVMKEFLAPFMPGFAGLTGAPDEVRQIAARFSAVFFKGMPTDRVGGYSVEHTSQVYLVDSNGALRATFYDAPADAMIEATRSVLRERAARGVDGSRPPRG